MQSRNWKTIGALAAVLLGTASAGAVEAEGGLPAEQRAGNIAYVTGGIDYGQSGVFQRARSRYPLSIELLQRVGNRNQYTADAQVRIVDGAGNAAFEARAEGPYMLVRLPNGSYRVEATLGGHTERSKQVNVGGQRSARVVLTFPESVEAGEPAPQPVRNGAAR